MQRPICSLLSKAFVGFAMVVASVSTGHACRTINCTKAPRVIVAAPAGGSTDAVIRLVASAMERHFDGPIIVENRPGARGIVGIESVLGAARDSKTLLATDASIAIAAALLPRANVVKDMVAVAGIARLPNVMVASLSLSVKTLPELIENARRNPGSITMASPGPGSLAHLSGALLNSAAGLNLPLVPFQGTGPSMTAVLGGEVGLTFLPLGIARDQINAGKVRALAVTSAKRVPSLPDVPAMSETVTDFEASGWVGLSAPIGMERDAIEGIQQAVQAALSDPDIRNRLAALGVEPFQGPPDAFPQLVAGDIQKWGSIARAANIKID
jgi:tripartite-type tricarboxylate transporter receptor subunit TctC